jgi:A/G-specific adenine glycosylase
MDIKRLEAWYNKHHRKLIFRETKHPYDVWISEIMLQQTQVDTVLPYFERFKKAYPTIHDLAVAKEDDLMKMVEGLGYYRRFRNMQSAAKVIVDKFGGEFPKTHEDIMSLPGIGAYTAGAIMSIAYNQQYSALDGNVIRVLTRYLADDRDMRVERHKKELNKINQSYIEKAHPYIYTQAMMELGALICKPKNPKCEDCPLAEHCMAYQQDSVDKYPVLTKLKSPKHIQYKTLIIHDGEYVFLRKRDEDLLKGMYEYPQFEEESIYSLEKMLEDMGIIIEIDQLSESYQHVFSHQKWLMDVHHARYISGDITRWVKVHQHDIDKLPMAVAHRKIIM